MSASPRFLSQRTVLCVTDSLRGHATAGVRGAFYREFFEREGWAVRTLDATAEPAGAILAAAAECGWVVLIKVSSLRLTRALRRLDGPVVAFDLSDALWMPLHRRAGWHDLERILGAVDVVFCENAFLVPFATRFNSRVFTAPTSVPLARFDAARVARPLRESPRVRVGWVGSRTTVSALEKVRGPLAALALRHPEMEIRIVGASPAAVAVALGPLARSTACTVVPDYDTSRMIEEMLSLDIGLYPEPFGAEDYAARGPLKALLYMAAGLPVVCAPGGDCSRLIEDGVNGMLARTPLEWEQKLGALVASSSLRSGQGAAALATARASQDPDTLYRGLQEALAAVRPGTRAQANRTAPASGRSSLGQALRSLLHRLDAVAARVRRAGLRAAGISRA